MVRFTDVVKVLEQYNEGLITWTEMLQGVVRYTAPSQTPGIVTVVDHVSLVLAEAHHREEMEADRDAHLSDVKELWKVLSINGIRFDRGKLSTPGYQLIHEMEDSRG